MNNSSYLANPLLPDLSEMADEELQQKISQINALLSSSRNPSVRAQAYGLLTHYMNAVAASAERQRAKAEEANKLRRERRKRE